MALDRILIGDVRPRTPSGRYPAKAVVGRPLEVSADILADGHDLLAARLLWGRRGSRRREPAALRMTSNDRWVASVTPLALGDHEFLIEAWVDRFGTWLHDTDIKHAAGLEVDLELEEGRALLAETLSRAGGRARKLIAAALETIADESLSQGTRLGAVSVPEVVAAVGPLDRHGSLTKSPVMSFWADRPLASFSSWYELFPRSYGGLSGAARHLGYIAGLGFDVVYLPPIHPVGRTNRKGRSNSLGAASGDPGSPWAIGSPEGGHTSVAPELGTLKDFDRFQAVAAKLGLEVAMDYALQCSPDHPWVSEHPEWFHHRPDGSIRFAENPPKKYQDIYPINFWPPRGRTELWEACREILDFWMGRGVKIFRVDNPHTKPFAFWAWLIPSMRAKDPEVIFLSEAFTRPKIMAKLAEVGFTQSYTYFTWRTTKKDLTVYLDILRGEMSDYFRPNFWPNTPDILSGPLRRGPRAAFKMRLLLAATMSPSYGIYSGYELCENIPESEENEEYRDSEKYEIKVRDFESPKSIAPFIKRLNEIRRAHPALHEFPNIRFHETSSPSVIAYSKATRDHGDVVLTVVNLDAERRIESRLTLDLNRLGFGPREEFEARDELTGRVQRWRGSRQTVSMDPKKEPGLVLHLRSRP